MQLIWTGLASITSPKGPFPSKMIEPKISNRVTGNCQVVLTAISALSQHCPPERYNEQERGRKVPARVRPSSCSALISRGLLECQSCVLPSSQYLLLLHKTFPEQRLHPELVAQTPNAGTVLFRCRVSDLATSDYSFSFRRRERSGPSQGWSSGMNGNDDSCPKKKRSKIRTEKSQFLSTQGNVSTLLCANHIVKKNTWKRSDEFYRGEKTKLLYVVCMTAIGELADCVTAIFAMIDAAV